MRSSIDKLIRALKAEKPPEKIWQESFDYLDPADYHPRLCNLNGSLPDNSDLCNYSLDIQYMNVQPDLLRFLLPVCLNAWQIDLLSEGDSVYGGFVEHFTTALAARSGCRDILKSNEYLAVMDFMCDSILDRIDREHGLYFSGYSRLVAAPYRWFEAIGTFAVVFPNLDKLWSIWWNMETTGYAIGVLQFISTLMYKKENNPIFDPWTREHGGGPPSIFVTEGFIYDQNWHPQNVSFLKQVLSNEYIFDALKKAANILGASIEAVAPKIMIDDFDAQKELLSSRIQQLPDLLLNGNSLSEFDQDQ